MKNKIFSFFLIIFATTLALCLPLDPQVANDYHHFFKGTISHVASLPYTWRNTITANGLGEYSLTTLWSWPLNYVYGLSDRLGINYSALFWLLGIIPFLFLGAWGIGKLFDYFKISCRGKRIGTLFFLVNSYTLLLLDGGQINLALAYCLLPLCFVSFIKALNKRFLTHKIKACLTTIVLSVLDIRIVYFLVLLVVFHFVFNTIFLKSWHKKLKFTANFLTTGLIVGLALVACHAYWILPAVLAKAPSLPAGYERSSQVSFLSFANLTHSLTLQSPHWYKNVFGKVSEISFEFFLIPFLVFLSPVLKRKNKNVAFWLSIALVSVFLVNGANEPLPQVYPWLFLNIPGFSLFRDPTKFFFLVALSYSMLIGITADELTKRYRWSLKTISILLTTYLFFLTSPLWLGKMTGTFSKPIYQNEYFKLADNLGEDKNFGRIFWIPTRAPLGYSSLTHPSVEASRLAEERPFSIGTVGSYEVFNFLREAHFMGEIFDITGISYIAYPYPDTRREELKQDNIDYYYAFLDQLTNLDWVDQRVFDPPVALLKTKKSQDHFFIPENTWLVVGSDRIYENLVKIPNFKLSDNAMIFVEEQSSTENWPDLINQYPHIKILQYEKSMVDVMASLLPREAFMFPATTLESEPNEAGWWKRESDDFAWIKNFLQEKYGIDNQDFDYGGGYAFAEGESRLQISNDKLLKGDVLLARVMKSSRGGEIEFWQDDRKVGGIDTKKDIAEKVEIKLTGYGDNPDQVFEHDKGDFSWFEVGELVPGNQSLEIRTEGDINIVNVLVSVSGKEWFSTDSRPIYNVLNWDDLSQEEINELFVLDDSRIKIDYEMVNSTHYKVKVENVVGPVTLAFSETYDPLWQLNQKQNSYPLYSLINGFTIEKDGEYDIYFSPQKYVYQGLLVSGITVLSLLILILIKKKRQK